MKSNTVATHFFTKMFAYSALIFVCLKNSLCHKLIAISFYGQICNMLKLTLTCIFPNSL